MNQIKNIIKAVIGQNKYHKLTQTYINTRELLVMIRNYYVDIKMYNKHSMVFHDDAFNKIESRIILHYHAIEKGFLHNDFRYRFAEARIRDMVSLMSLEEVLKQKNNSQIAAAYLCMCKYYERHISNNVDISDYFPNTDYEKFKAATTFDLEIVENQKKSYYFEHVTEDFKDFSVSRASVRNFTGERVPIDIIKNVIDLAKHAPSVCNRQPTKVYFVENKDKIDQILKIQGGLTGYTKNITQLMVVVTDRNYFYSTGERNQLYVDGGIFVMNLLYSLHYYKVAACPAHWGHDVRKDIELLNVIDIKESEKVICIIPVGIPDEDFKTTLSLRREVGEILKII